MASWHPTNQLPVPAKTKAGLTRGEFYFFSRVRVTGNGKVSVW